MSNPVKFSSSNESVTVTLEGERFTVSVLIPEVFPEGREGNGRKLDVLCSLNDPLVDVLVEYEGIVKLVNDGYPPKCIGLDDLPNFLMEGRHVWMTILPTQVRLGGASKAEVMRMVSEGMRALRRRLIEKLRDKMGLKNE